MHVVVLAQCARVGDVSPTPSRHFKYTYSNVKLYMSLQKRRRMQVVVAAFVSIVWGDLSSTGYGTFIVNIKNCAQLYMSDSLRSSREVARKGGYIRQKSIIIIMESFKGYIYTIWQQKRIYY